jgi:hypothetical protein
MSTSGSGLVYGSSTFSLTATGTTRIGLYSTSGNELTMNNTAGNGVYSPSFNSTSDIALKENIQPISGALSIVQSLNGVYYTLKSNPNLGRQVGFIAQEVDAVLPEVVTDGAPNAYLSISYGHMVAVLANAIKELKAEVDALKAK